MNKISSKFTGFSAVGRLILKSQGKISFIMTLNIRWCQVERVWNFQRKYKEKRDVGLSEVQKDRFLSSFVGKWKSIQKANPAFSLQKITFN